MRFTAAFAALGYSVANPRQDWSADGPDGVCITLWRKEMGFSAGSPWVDTVIHAQDNALWRSKPGNKKRLKHLNRAILEFGGYVDVVIVHGNPGEGAGEADPWIPGDRKGGRWLINSVDPETGHFSASVVLPAP